MSGEFGLGIALLSVAIWVGLLAVWGGFWRCDQRLEGEKFKSQNSPTPSPLPSSSPTPSSPLPFVCAVIPARNEADVLPVTLRSLLCQSYPGAFQIVLVDDQSTDGTGAIAQETAAALGKAAQLTVLDSEPLPAGWTGKLWAMEQGVRHTRTMTTQPDYLLLTDADIEHDPDNLQRLVAKAQQDDRDLVSLMVLLRCQSVWEKLLIPAFVFFFQKLYPFPLVNNPHKRVAAAAGGCSLIRRTALERIGGLQVLRQALIDDCTLAQKVKMSSRRIWLGLTQSTRSVRPYDSLQTIWDMVARTAYTQLNYSPFWLVGTVLGMTLVYLVSPIAAIIGLVTANWMLSLAGVAGWALMTLAYFPTIRLYRLSPLWAVCLPAIAFLYNLMTIDSAIRHWRGKGGAWKGRVYPSV
ncbi:MAG: glycosyltransferase [Oscillatoriales cyanobacterium C42_A2020_001]|nr:glycosyltransferase [Leptolyngbyaceae cyanobacterium C42_A2020_001]